MKRLLIADDDAGMRAALEARFQRRGWLIDVAVNGTEALEKFRASSHSLVITDVRMPGRDGFELMREVQASSARTAVILLTAYGCVPDAVEAMRNGACDYGKIGDWIEKLGFASEHDVTTALALQWGCPVASSFDPSTIESPGSIPLPILEAFQMLPLNYVAATNTLYLAFGERVDHAALYAIEKILDCRTQPCVAGRKSIARKLDALRQTPRPSEVEFGPMNDLAEMARIAASYTARLSPEQVRLCRIGRFIWLRLDVGQDVRSEARVLRTRMRPITTNLVFRLQTESTRPNSVTQPFHDLPFHDLPFRDLSFRDLDAATLPGTLPHGADVSR
jgi:CheY-like chemotaxis protein